ncbi:type IX secretion system periplasmic lipoprotein PorW/SprE [Sphingobacterium alkalisoli]|uniref:type IX secretion system periplasmic lipoprotein PorW/SprE n=1 Tax=Sphingobacterium alkalisoli TaxID=1874115 RepID=UPI001FD585DB|nr:tetratricopeptide repeat protein [Sphingobacterium alkalisoli]
MKKICFLLFLGLTTSAFVMGCKGIKKNNSTFQKADAEDDTIVRYNFMQNVTTKYNILYNANLMLEKERDAIANTKKHNYQIRQTVFDEPAAQGDSHVMMDSLVKKAYKVVNTKQESKYVNEAYFIIGKTNYYKGSYYTALEFFDQIIRNSGEQVGFVPMGYAWKSRALLQIGKEEQAKLMVDSAFATLSDEKDVRTFVNASKANYLIRNGEELEAIPYLEYALESNSDLSNKRRWMFLLAQLYRDNGQPEQALQYFQQISRSNVPYDMAFEASLQTAFLKGNSYSSIEDRVKPLKRMLREGKNDGYQDQILFQIGDIYYADGKIEEALAAYSKSLSEPKRNNYQTTETYLKLGDHYFENGKYQLAQLYYDSVAIVLPADYTDVNKIRRKLGYMSEITRLYEEIAWQDTLLQLAGLNEPDLESVLEGYADVALQAKKFEIEKAKQAKTTAKNKRNTSQNSNAALMAFNTPTNSLATNSDKTFYFNNQDELVLGQSSFRRRWGNRQLKDNWRYEADNSAAVKVTQNVPVGPDLVKDDEIELDEALFVSAVKSKYTSEIPKEKEAYEASHKKVHDNLIVIGNIYRDYTKDNIDAIKVYEEFLRRYPNTEAGAEIYYSLYRMYDGLDQAKSLDYKTRLIALYPKSLHAQIALDPSYMDKLKRDKNILDRVFEKLFTLYTNGDHATVISEADKDLKERFANTGLVAQVEYLRALAIGRVGRVDDFTEALNDIVAKYPADSLVVPLAKENLAFIVQHPDYFTHRVNALQDIDKSRVAFIDEPHMTAWPSLGIDGDYRTGTAIVQEIPKPKEELLIAKVEPKVEQLTNNEVAAKVEKEKIPAKVEVAIKDEIKNKEPEKETLLKIEEKAVSEELNQEVVVEIEEEERRLAGLSGIAVDGKITANTQANTNVSLGQINRPLGQVNIDLGPNDYRDKKLFPDTATYYFTINVMDAKLNMAPSRYGVGQFNRTRYAQSAINHQLKMVNGENQLIFIGPFNTFEEVKGYESKILPMMHEIMKVPVEIYNTFVITKDVFPSLTDGVQIKNYHQTYSEQ